MQLEVGAAGQATIDHRLLEYDAADAAGLKRLAGDVVADEPGAAAGRLDRRREHPYRGRLAGAVGTEQAEDLAAGDLEVDPLHGLHPARVGLLEPGHLTAGATRSSAAAVPSLSIRPFV